MVSGSKTAGMTPNTAIRVFHDGEACPGMFQKPGAGIRVFTKATPHESGDSDHGALMAVHQPRRDVP